MSLVPFEFQKLCKFYWPHHCVLKEDTTTTQLHVVFDGSAKTSSEYSLNEILMAGPTLQPKLFHTLLQFRTFPVALTMTSVRCTGQGTGQLLTMHFVAGHTPGKCTSI